LTINRDEKKVRKVLRRDTKTARKRDIYIKKERIDGLKGMQK
jgi:hypothetical protein